MSFDRFAPHYRWIENLSAGEKLQDCRVAWLDKVSECRHALLIGEGNGRFLAACVRRFPNAQFTVVDASKQMLRLAEASWRRAGGDPARVSFVHAALPGLELPDQQYDLIVTHYFLDCFTAAELADIIKVIASLGTPSCKWLIADFAAPERGFRRWRARVILRLLYLFFRWTTGLSGDCLVSPAPYLEQFGFARKEHVAMDLGLLQSDLWTRAV